MTDSIKPPVETPSFEFQMIEYLRARLRQEAFGTKDSIEFMPHWVPSAIRITEEIKHWASTEGKMHYIKPGDVPCVATVFGLIMIAGGDWGRTIRIDFFHCEILAFRWNESRATVLREREAAIIEKLKLEPEATNADPT